MESSTTTIKADLLEKYPHFKSILNKIHSIEALYIDLFCGAGGVTEGVLKENKLDVLFAVNHDPMAIESHQSNHQHVIHSTEDIRSLDITDLIHATQVVRAENPRIKICLWASLECTHFSKAKGGDSRDADSRTLAQHLYRYIEYINPDYIDIENVIEFMSWGPLRIACQDTLKNKSILKLKNNGDYHFIPESKKNGKYYYQWYQNICNRYNYQYDYRILNAADYGAYTSRKRYFGQFKKPQLEFSWPQPTHSKDPKPTGLFNQLQKWKPVSDKLNLSIEGNSIFNRKKNLSENTLKRIYNGLLKHVSDEQEKDFFIKYYSTGRNTQSLNVPAGTITTKDRFALINTHYLDKYYSGEHNHQNIQRPLGTITTTDKHNLITVKEPQKMYYLLNPQFNNKGNSIDKPCFTLIARMDKKPPYLIESHFASNKPYISESDSPMTQKIKSFMLFKGISDIKMRLLEITELKTIQGFDKDYILRGTTTQQKKFIGNSVEVNLAHQKAKARLKAILSFNATKKIAS